MWAAPAGNDLPLGLVVLLAGRTLVRGAAHVHAKRTLIARPLMDNLTWLSTMHAVQHRVCTKMPGRMLSGGMIYSINA